MLNLCSHLIPKSILDTIPLITANSSVKVNLPREHVISAKPKNAKLEPLAPVRVICDLANLLLVFILSHKDFKMQFQDAPESVLAIKLYPLLLALQRA